MSETWLAPCREPHPVNAQQTYKVTFHAWPSPASKEALDCSMWNTWCCFKTLILLRAPAPPPAPFPARCTRVARSPLLATMSGSVAAWVSSFAILRLAFFPDQLAPSIEGGVAEVVHIPMVLWGFTVPYAVRGVRLIVLYNPHMRGRWGRILNEPPTIRKLMALFLATEAIAWSAGLVYGVDRQERPCPDSTCSTCTNAVCLRLVCEKNRVKPTGFLVFHDLAMVRWIQSVPASRLYEFVL